MARDIYQSTATLADASGILSALADIQVSVYTVNPDGTQGPLATIYQARSGGAQGPSPNAGATAGTNPFNTGPTGGIEFWADPGEYLVVLHDTHTSPVRISDRTIGWNAVPGAAGGIPTSRIAADGGLSLNHQGADIQRQQAQLGQVIEWWRPASDIPVPTGWEICDGHTLTAANHDFGGSAAGITITLPNLIDKFVLGADPTKADGSAGHAADGTGIAPGLGGSGGSHTQALTTNNLPAHSHPVTDPGHSHTLQGANNLSSGGGGYHVQLIGQPVNWGGVSPGSDGSTTGITVGNQTTTNTAHNNIPAYVGLLKIMKVRRS